MIESRRESESEKIKNNQYSYIHWMKQMEVCGQGFQEAMHGVRHNDLVNYQCEGFSCDDGNTCKIISK